MSLEMLWDEPQGNFRLNRHDEQLGYNLSSEKRPSVSFDSSSMPKRQRFSRTDLDNTETIENGNGENSPQLSEPNNFGFMGGHNGHNSAPLPELNDDEALGFGNRHNPVSDLQGQLLSRDYFVFYLGNSLLLSYTNLNASAFCNVRHYINQVLPTVKAQDIINPYLTTVQKEIHDPAMDGKSFEYRLRNRLLALAKYFGFSQMRVADLCQKLVAIWNDRPVNVDMLDDGLGFQALIAHLYSLKKKVIFMSDSGGNIGGAISKGH